MTLFFEKATQCATSSLHATYQVKPGSVNWFRQPPFLTYSPAFIELHLYPDSLCYPKALDGMPFPWTVHLYMLAFIKHAYPHIVFRLLMCCFLFLNARAFQVQVSFNHSKPHWTLSGCWSLFTIFVIPHSSTQDIRVADKILKFSGHFHFMLWGSWVFVVSPRF